MQPACDRFAASFAQERLFVLRELHPSANLNICVLVTLQTPIAASRLRGAVEALCQRHEALRTSFEIHNGRLEQVIHGAVSLDASVVELPEPGGDQTGMWERARMLAAESMDLRCPPLFIAIFGRDARRLGSRRRRQHEWRQSRSRESPNPPISQSPNLQILN